MATEGATALKLENEIVEEQVSETTSSNQLETNNVLNTTVSENNGLENFELSDDDTPELFNSDANEELSTSPQEINSEEEEDLEIPAFLRRQKN